MNFLKGIAIILVAVILLQACGGTRQVPKLNTETHQLDEAPRLARITSEGKLGGVCAGVAYFFGVPTWLVRVGFVITVFAFGTGVLAYVVLWAFMPKYASTPPLYEQRTN